MNQGQATVLWNQEKAPAYYHMGLACTGYDHAVPGQFVMVRVSERTAPLLRRPFSIHKLIREDKQVVGIELLYKVVGAGTRVMAETQKHASLGLIGPVGRGFTLTPLPETAFLVGGGIGVPPLVFLAATLKQRGMDMAGCRMFLGGRSREDLLCQKDFTALGIRLHLTTDDGSTGEKCLVTHPLEKAVAESPPAIIYACGPLPMLSCVVGISRKHDVPCQVSIESMMACGMGACLGCAVKKADKAEGYWHVCKDGPVFDGKDLAL